MSSETVSIVIPTYKRPEKLERAVKSVLAQTHKNLRVLIFDNASNDTTERVIARLRSSDDRIEYFRHENNLGMVKNVNFAFGKVTTPFLGILPDDDYYLPNFIEDAMRAYDAHPEIKISILSAPTVDEDGNFLSDQLEAWPREGVYQAGESIKLVINGQQPIITTCIFRCEIAEELRYDEEAGVIADIPVLISLLAKYSFHISRTIGGYFIKHAQSSGPQFAHRSNVRAICSAFLRVEQCVVENKTIAINLKSKIVRVLSKRVDKAFNDLLLANTLARDSETFQYLQTIIVPRRQFTSLSYVYSLILCGSRWALGSRRFFNVLAVVRRVSRILRRRSSESMHAP